MSVLLYVVGAIAVMVGVAMVAYGIPINEFSFGNTLIVAGTTAAVGGLIVIAHRRRGRPVAAHRRSAATRTPVRSGRPLECSKRRPARARRRSRRAFRSRPGRNGRCRCARAAIRAPAEAPAEDQPSRFGAPTLHNPDVPVAAQSGMSPVKAYEDVSLSPRHPPPARPPIRRAPVASRHGSAWPKRPEPAFDEPPGVPRRRRRRAGTSGTDELFRRHVAGRNQAGEGPAQPSEAKPERRRRRQPRRQRRHRRRPTSRAVAILKSGVVDGMGYTLYVDGSIEAELPQGTLRFASINELRSHLEKNS